MNSDDDTIRTDPQAREDALLAMLDAGAFDSLGIRRAGFDNLDEIANVESPLAVVRVAHDCFEEDLAEVVNCAIALRFRLVEELPENVRGRVVLAFDGWNGDPRPLAEIPPVVLFCRALLFGPDVFRVSERAECARVAAPVLAVLFDERIAWNGDADPERPPDRPEFLEAAGSLWLTGHAFAEDVFFRHAESPTGYARDIAANLAIHDALRGRG